MQTGAVLFGSPLGPRSPQTIYHAVYNALPREFERMYCHPRSAPCCQQRFVIVCRPPPLASSARPLYLRFAITNTPGIHVRLLQTSSGVAELTKSSLPNAEDGTLRYAKLTCTSTCA